MYLSESDEVSGYNKGKIQRKLDFQMYIGILYNFVKY